MPEINPVSAVNNWSYSAVKAGKQPATASVGEENTTEPIITEPDGECVQLVSFEDAGVGCSIDMPRSVQKQVQGFVTQVGQEMRQALAVSTKIADLPAGLKRIETKCKEILKEQRRQLDLTLTQVRRYQSTNALMLADKVRWFVVEEVLDDPKELFVELGKCIEEVKFERDEIQNIIPSNAKVLASAIFILAVLAPIASLCWWGLISLACFAISTTILHSIGAIGTTTVVAAGLARGWADFKNARADEEYKDEQALIQNYDSLISIYEEVSKKMYDSQIHDVATHQKTHIAGTVLTFAKSTEAAHHSREANSKLERLEQRARAAEAQLAASEARAERIETMLKQQAEMMKTILSLGHQSAQGTGSTSVPPEPSVENTAPLATAPDPA